MMEKHYFTTKVRLVKAMVFPIVMYGYESWTIKKAEHRRIYTFEFWCWRRLLSVPLDIKEIQPVNPKRINPEYSLEGLLLKLQYFSHLMQRADSLERTLMLGGTEGKRGREWKKMRWLDSITDSMDMNLRKLQEIVEDREAWCITGHRVTKSHKETEQQCCEVRFVGTFL